MRVALFLAIVLVIRQKHAAYRAEQALARAGAVPIERLRRFYPDAQRIQGLDLQRNAQIVSDAGGTSLGFFVQTSPACDHVIGYLGPTNVLIAFDDQSRVLGIDVLDSRDTTEHVEDVVGDHRFMSSYDGLTWREAAAQYRVDGVSGATLTSLAMVEAISHRLGAPCPSLRFPDDLAASELRAFLPRAATIQKRPRQGLVYDVLDEAGRRVGGVVRTSPTCDGVAGYQGPTDTLIVLDAQDRVARIALRSSYDNEPYVSYVRDDEYFCTLFNHLELAELSRLDFEVAEVEGVSGATMTSMAVAETLTRTAAAAMVRQTSKPSVVISARDLGTCVILVSALVMSFSHLRGKTRLRLAFRWVLVIYLGFLNGDVLSQALFVGWAQSGVPWRLAPGLVLLSCAALVVPVLSKRQLYCHHFCPFGAAQQLIRGRTPWRLVLSQNLQRGLKLIPPALLLLVVLTAVLHLPINLASIEPFNAFVFWIAGAATLTIAVVGLAFSAIVPMAYCRFGCPTGGMLDFLRYHGHSDRLSRRDLFAAVLLGLALVF